MCFYPAAEASIVCGVRPPTGPGGLAQPDLGWSQRRPAPAMTLSHGAAASTTQTGPRANVIGWPDAVVNLVPPSASGRDQRTS